MKQYVFFIILGFLLSLQAISANEITPKTLTSPDNKLKVTVTFNKGNVEYSIEHCSTVILEKSPLSITLSNGEMWGKNVKQVKVKQNYVKETYPAFFYKRNIVIDEFKEMILTFPGNYGIEFRAYNNAISYRFISNIKNDITIENEEVLFNIPENPNIYATYVNSNAKSFEDQMFNSFEDLYYYKPLRSQNSKKLMTLPILSELMDGKKLLFTEVNLNDYPGMFLNNCEDKSSLRGVFAKYPKIKTQGGHNNLQMLVVERESYIAKTKGTRSFPWRLLFVSENDVDLLNSDVVYCLSEPSRLGDISWIKPGKVAWDWWNDWNLKHVDFKAGINNETYKYYIDFASKNKIEYVILDEGWSVHQAADLMQVIPEINLQEIVDYGKKQNVGIILWAGYWAIHRDMEKIIEHYSRMGVKGFKIDFLDRDDQEMVNFVYEVSDLCAKNKMLIDFHGTFKPTGLQRTYPNVLNFEGVAGLEQMKWQPNNYDMVTHDVTLPFIRMFNGPIDYTQGAMRNAQKSEYFPVWSNPMSQGTRCRQLAEYVIFESPLNMLCDNPVNYMNEIECTNFISGIPTVWDETVVIDAKIGEYILIARKKDNVWYIGGLTDWKTREITINFDFLNLGDYKVELFKDGINADKNASDYSKVVFTQKASNPLHIKMMQGGGFAMKITK